MIHAPNSPGILGEIATIIAKQNGNITNVRFVSQDERSAQLEVDIAVENARHLENTIAALRASPAVESVDRVRGKERELA
jgi:GTP pyrophosphokinase